jgi:molybdopterin-binding protein
MSRLIATVSKIQSCDNLNIVEFNFHEIKLTMMSLDLNATLKVGSKVKLLVKPTHIALAKEFSGEVSYSNQLPTTIVSLENGTLLSSIELEIFDVKIESVITLNSSKRMNLMVGDKVTAFIKASDLSIGEILND